MEKICYTTSYNRPPLSKGLGKGKPFESIWRKTEEKFDLSYETVGELDSRHEIVADWKEPNKKGVIYYMQSGRVRGVLLWNVWNQVDAARKLIAEPGPFRAEDLKRRLPETH